MRKIIPVYLLLISVVFAKGQTTDTAFASVRYTFLYVADTTSPAVISSEDMILYLGKNISVFKSYNQVLLDSFMEGQRAQQEAAFRSGGPITFSSGGIRVGYKESFYKNAGTGKLTRTEKIIKEYLIEENMPGINWEITQEVKDISGLSCQKAITDFRGRKFVAWFCSQLPYSNGPWKLGGLPGLIIEAADSKNEVVYKFAGFEDVAAKHLPIAFPPTMVKATLTEFNRLRDASMKDPEAFIINNNPNIKWTRFPEPPYAMIQKASKNPIERTSN